MKFASGALKATLPLVLAAMLAACGSTPRDETANMSAEKLYSEAKEEATGGNYDKASKLFEKLEGRGAGTLLSQQAEIELAYAQYKANERPAALATIEKFIRLHPTSPALDYAMYLRGLISFNDDLGLFGSMTRQDLSERDQQASRDAFQAFKQLVEQFPESPYTPDARLRMQYIVNTLASYEVHVARYYYKRGAYLASANRAQQAVKEFQQTPAARDALELMVQNYDKLGLTALRDDAARVLKQNYPDAATEEVLRSKDKPWWQIW